MVWKMENFPERGISSAAGKIDGIYVGMLSISGAQRPFVGGWYLR